MLKVILSGLCVLAAAAPLAAAVSPASIAGRWQGKSWAQQEQEGALTLDIVRCGEGWCGIKVGSDNSCGATALKIGGGRVEPDSDYIAFEGSLQLAPKTEAYVVQVSIFEPDADEGPGKPLKLQITGDTGGQFRAYRRSFPYEAQLVRSGDAVCHAPQTVSSLR